MASDDALGFWLQQAGRVPLLTAAEELHLGTLVRAWQDHPAGIDEAPAGVKRRGARARDRIVNANLRLVVAVTMRVRAGCRGRVGESDLPDMLQAGAIGLIRGAERFDPARGYKFSTFGYWWIRQGISRWLVSSSRLIYIPHNFSDRLGKLGRLGEELALRLGRGPSLAELAGELGMASDDLQQLLTVAGPCLSLDAPPSSTADQHDRGTLGSIVAAQAPEPDPQVQALRERLALLPPHIAGLVADCWGLDGTPIRIGAAARRAGLTINQAKAALLAAERELRGEVPPPPPLPEPDPADPTPLHQLSFFP